MGLLKGAAQKVLAAERRVPESVRRFVHSSSPLDYFFDEPIGQIVLADDEFDTYLCINNFFTVLNPEVRTPIDLEVAIHGADGKEVLRTRRGLAADGSIALSARELLAEKGARVPIGLAWCALRPRMQDARAVELFKQMGRISSHFFTYYLNPRSEAMAIIHPQSAVRQRETGDRAWRSGQSIVTEGLESIRLYQANHGVRRARVNLEVCDAKDDRVLAAQRVDVVGMSAGVAEFKAQAFGASPVLYVRSDRLPTPNGKPLLMRRYGGGRFSMNHA